MQPLQSIIIEFRILVGWRGSPATLAPAILLIRIYSIQPAGPEKGISGDFQANPVFCMSEIQNNSGGASRRRIKLTQTNNGARLFY